MALSNAKKAEIVKEFGANDKDTGSVEVQAAILTAEIKELNEHLSYHIHDFSSKRGLMKKIGQRRSIMEYLKKNDLDRYNALVKKLGLRH